MKTIFVVLSCFVFAFVGQSCQRRGQCYSSGKFIIQDLRSATFVHGTKTEYGHYINNLRVDSITLGSHERIGYDIIFQDSAYDFSLVEASTPLLSLSVYATDPCKIDYDFMDSFESISFTTINDFDSAHDSGSNVSEYFSFLKWSQTMELDSLNQIISYLNSQSYVNGPGSALLVLKETPRESKELRFNINVRFTSGREVSVNTVPVFLKH
ncbi:MAG: hypothetical protein ACI9UJ_001493 [bacterium]|jgi:hypothetical protein